MGQLNQVKGALVDKSFAKALYIFFVIVMVFTLIAVTQSPMYKALKAEKVLAAEINSLMLITWLDSYEEHIEDYGNPFYVGQRVYPAIDFELTLPTNEFMSIAIRGAVVVDMTREHVRVLFDDGSVKIYAHAWFIALEGDLHPEPYWGDEWIVGNQFVVGQEVCASIDSVREPFPDKGIVSRVDGEFIYLEGYDGFINFAHFQECR